MSIESLPTTGIPDRERPLLTGVAEEAADESLGVDELGSRIVGLAGRVASATCRWLLLVGRFDAQEGFQHFGLPSTARWLSHYCGISVRTASDHVRVARALTAHEGLRTEMVAGRLSYSQVRAISRVVDLGDEQLLANLIMVAEHGTVRHLEEVVRGLRSVDDNAREPSRPTPEYVAHRWRPDSRWGLSARLDPENGALVQSVLETVARTEGINQAQALIRMAEIARAALAADGAPSLRGDQLAAIQVHVNADAVPAKRAEDGPSVAGLSAAEIADRIRELAPTDAP